MSQKDLDPAAYKTLEESEPIILDGPNLFADLGMEDADDLLMRSRLMRRIDRAIEVAGLSKGVAAKLVGMPGPEMTHLLKGRISRFSIERLVKVLNRLEPETRVTIEFSTPEPASARSALEPKSANSPQKIRTASTIAAERVVGANASGPKARRTKA